MYKLLLCWRYLLTRYLALACIISVMLGVATLIVVNSVMSGFSTKLKDRLHGLLSDILIESMHADGFSDPAEKIRRIRQSAIGDKIAAMTPTIEILGLIQITHNGHQLPPRPVRLIGIDPQGRAAVGGFSEHLVQQKNSTSPSFELTPEARLRHELNYPPLPLVHFEVSKPRADEPPPPDLPPSQPKQNSCAIVGHAIASYRDRLATGPETRDRYLLQLGDEVILTTVSGQRLAPVYDSFIVCDFFKSEMSEYDSSYVFVPIEHLQRLRAMEGRVTGIQVKLKNYDDAHAVVMELTRLFDQSSYRVETWEEKQGALLAAISIEKGILNVLLFLIICVAGFGILAIFAMIVVEKTRDIGVLKALGASNGGVMSIFLGYGLLLGIVGAVLGTAAGLTLTININEFERLLSQTTGHEIFDRSIYYFDRIPTHIQAWNVVLVNVGSVGIAVFFSIIPALRAALLHPVRALRYE